MKWENIEVQVGGKRFDLKSLSCDSDMPVAPTVMGSIVVSAENQFEQIRHLLPPSQLVEFTHALFSPGAIKEPRAWLLRWARKNGLELVYDNAFSNDDRWIVGFAGEFPKSYPEQLVRLTLEL